MNAFRKLWESVVYAGMQPGVRSSRVARLFGPFRGPVERFLAGGLAPTDPLYLTNRTFGQKLRTALVVAAPCLIVMGVIALGVGHYIGVREKPQRQLSAAELAETMLPNLGRDVHVTTNRDLEVTEARVELGSPRVVLGTVKNNTDRAIENAEVVFDLTTDIGARLGAVSARIAHVDARSTATFRINVDQDTAAFALVREVVLQ